MTFRANRALRLAPGSCALAGLLGASAALAQAPLDATSGYALNPAPAGAAAYQDRVISGGTLKPDISIGDADGSDTEGLARSLQIDGVVSQLSSSGAGSSTNAVESGVVGKYQWDTAMYGAWSLDASARAGSSDLGPSEQGQGGVLTIRQRAMPFDRGWFTDNALGDVNSPDIGLARAQTRFFLPTGAVQGLSSEWHGPDGLQMVASAGVPGLYDGIEVADFRTLGGSTATVGAQWSPAPQWTLGGQFIDAHDVNLAIGPVVDGAERQSSDAALVSAAWQEQGEKLQFNLLDGDVRGNGDRLGAWLDGSIAQGHMEQSAGLFRIDPDMTWGNQVISSDVEGAYYRFDYQNRKWTADLGIDEARSVSGLGPDVTFLTGNARYQLQRDWGLGGAVNISHCGDGAGESLEGFVDHLNPWGSGRAQINYADTQSGTDRMVTLEQTWTMPVGTRLSTTLSAERISDMSADDSLQDSTVLGIAIFGGGQITAKLGVDANVRWASTVAGNAAPAVSTNVSLTYQLSRAWQVLATYYDSQTGYYTPLTVVSPLSPPVATPVPAQRESGVFLTLRYKRASGLHFAPLGGAPGAASGELSGIVFLDANDNGHYDAGEIGAPNVTVVLDGRFSVQTDATGRYDFPAVAAGHHVISVVPDNLPLPWYLLDEGRAEVVITTRDRTDVDIAARRMR